MPELFRDELMLDSDQFNKPKVLTELDSLAQEIQNVIIIKPGTMPNDPLFGVGIANYLFEFLDTTTINEIQNSIDSQISKYITHNSVVVNSKVDILDTGQNQMKALVVEIIMYPSDNKEDTTTLTFAIAGNKTTKNIVSTLLTN